MNNYEPFRVRLGLNVAITLLSFLALSCSTVSSQRSNLELPGNERRTPDIANIRTKYQKAFDETIGHISNGPIAWSNLTRDGKYRLAAKEDFKFPNGACKEDSNCMEWAINLPILDGEIDGDVTVQRPDNDVAAIVVDKTIESENRFGVVIFNATPDPSAIPVAHWLMRDKDLSKAKLGYSRDGLSVSLYNDDGSYINCYARWDKARDEYDCKFLFGMTPVVP